MPGAGGERAQCIPLETNLHRPTRKRFAACQRSRPPFQRRSWQCNAIVEDRASYLNSIKNKVFDYRKADLSDTKIVGEGPTGVVTGRAQIAVVVGGQERALNARYTAVWVKVGDDWKFVAWESTSIPD